MNAFEIPAPFRLVPGFLGDDLIERLLAFANANRDIFVPARVGLDQGEVAPEIRSSLMTSDFGPMKEEIKARFAAIREQAVADLRLSSFEPASIELQLVAHGDGAFYKRHIDTSMDTQRSDTDRVLTGVLYFHALPKGFSGGQLRLHSILRPEQGGTHVDVEPERDMLLLFPAWAPHEVRPVSCPSGEFARSRFAINCWYRKPIAA
jgi:Rps23 Pro-64 3,4-dihydroxylase Tpa1-like proline 4-hydroxylase